MNALSTWFAELSPRERRLVSAFGIAFGVLLLFLVPYGVESVLRARRDANNELREAIAGVQKARASFKAKQAKKDQIAAKYNKKAPKLGGFLEQLAKEAKLEIPEAQDKQEIPIGKRYVERATQVRMRKVGGLALLTFLEKIEQSGYPVAINRLNIRKRGSDHDSYDIELAVSAYDRNDAPAAAAPAASASAEGAK